MRLWRLQELEPPSDGEEYDSDSLHLNCTGD